MIRQIKSTHPKNLTFGRKSPITLVSLKETLNIYYLVLRLKYEGSLT